MRHTKAGVGSGQVGGEVYWGVVMVMEHVFVLQAVLLEYNVETCPSRPDVPTSQAETPVLLDVLLTCVCPPLCCAAGAQAL